MSTAYQPWDYTLRVYTVVPCDSLVFCYAADGDVAGLRVLFDAKRATPFDIDCDFGETLLHVSTISIHYLSFINTK